MIKAADIKVDRASKEPLYEQIRRCIIESVRSGKWAPHQKLPSYKSLAEQTDVSMITIQQSVGALVKEGVLYRKRGVGVFTAPPDRAARKLRQIGLLLPDVRHPFFSGLAHLVQAQAARREYATFIFSLSGTYEEIARTAGLLPVQAWAGIITSPDIAERFPLEFSTLQQRNLPMVFIDGASPVGEHHYVETDNRKAIERTVQHLVDLGHRRIGFAAGPLTKGVRERIDYYKTTLQRSGLPFEPPLLQVGTEEDSRAGEQAGLTLLSLKRPPTAIICANDLVAAGVLGAAKSLSLACPTDVSIVGFDDLPLAGHLDPPLTTCRQPTVRIAEKAVELLLEIVGNEAARTPAQGILFEPEFVVRASTAPPCVPTSPARTPARA